MTTPKDARFVPGRGTPNDAPVEMNDAEDRTSRMGSEPALELPPLPVETTPGHLRLVPKGETLTRPPTGMPVDELIGRKCGGYVIDALLGEGGMGKVYRATNPRMGKRAAVKVIRPDHSSNPQTVDRFLQEAKAAAQIDDPNIIDLLDANELDDGRAYLLLPFVEGISLEELCEQLVVMPLEVAATILFQICSGLDAAHQHGIIHRDIKPHNILVGRRQQREHFVRIVDFGIAKLLDPHLAGQFKTQTLALMGTPGYMSPEQSAGGRNIDARADVYAVGVVAYRMLTGRRPYMEDSLYALIERQVSDAPFPRPRELRPDLPIEWDEAIMAALANKRDQRLATVRELALRLARGLPEGEQMLRALAPRLAASPLPPTAATLNPFLDHDIARRTGSNAATPNPFLEQDVARRAGSQPRPRTPRGRQIGFAPWQLALFTCLLVAVGVLGGVVFRNSQPSRGVPDAPTAPLSTAAVTPQPAPPQESLAGAPAKEPDAHASAEPTVGADPSQAVGAASPRAPSAPVEEGEGVVRTSPPAAGPTPASAPSRLGEGRGRSSPSSSGKTPRNPAVAGDSPRSEEPGTPGEKSESGPLSRDESARLAKLGIGLLIVNAKPWAQISINGKLDGYTPKRKQLPAGRYTIRMTKDSRNEDVVVVISPGKVSTVERSFR
jgi:serine/threonine protein kinase